MEIDFSYFEHFLKVTSLQKLYLLVLNYQYTFNYFN